MPRLFVALSAILLLPALNVHAHSWYPRACCSGQDCRPIDASEVRSTPAGWYVEPTGEVIPYGDRRERLSRDGKFHRCSRHFFDQRLADSTICLFVPGMAS